MIGANYKRILVGVFGLFILAGIGVQAQEKVNQTVHKGKDMEYGERIMKAPI